MCPWCDVHRGEFADGYSKNSPVQTNMQRNGVRAVQESRWTLDDVRRAQGGGWGGEEVMAHLGSGPCCLVAGSSLRRPAPG